VLFPVFPEIGRITADNSRRNRHVFMA